MRASAKVAAEAMLSVPVSLPPGAVSESVPVVTLIVPPLVLATGTWIVNVVLVVECLSVRRATQRVPWHA